MEVYSDESSQTFSEDLFSNTSCSSEQSACNDRRGLFSSDSGESFEKKITESIFCLQNPKKWGILSPNRTIQIVRRVREFGTRRERRGGKNEL